jgi:tRNA(fMet)-specific endonuclease VapC
MICLDTNAVIGLINSTSARLRQRFDAQLAGGGAMTIPAVVLFELSYGAANSERPKENHTIVKEFLGGPVAVLDFTAEDAIEAGDIRASLERKGTPIGPYDILIAAQARRHGALLVTANLREFKRVPRLRTENWET